MITIKEYGKNWRITLQDEIWQCEDREDMERVLKILLDLKEKKGRLKENEK
ncbi:MAG: hypothetical protein M0R17_05800 [Candidatus Omnitrophica bacterium]|jgi:hypothetical protein|nr:hypothetical protein [Candidatus Omnitrophota bacterium]